MKNITTILGLILILSFPLIAQNHAFKFGIRTQLSTGGVFTYSENVQKALVDGRETHAGLQQSLQATIFTPLEDINLGLGAGLSLRTGDVIYPSVISPKVFMMIELANGTKRTLLSLILNFGVMQGSIEKKTCFYLGGGPSFNIGKVFNNVTLSINPYFEFHMGEKATRYYTDSRYVKPGIQVPYDRHFKTTTINLSCIVQFNYNRMAKKNK